MQKIIPIFLLVSFLMSCSCSNESDGKNSELLEADSLGLLVNQIRSCSKLYTAEVKLHKVVIKDDPFSVSGDVAGIKLNIDIPAGDRKIAIPMNATAKAYVDFSGFSNESITIDGDNIIVELPDPKVVLTSTEIDHDEVRKSVSFFRSDFTDEEITRCQKEGREEIIRMIPKSGVLEKAESGAAAVIVPMLMELGYKDKNIQVKFNRGILSDPVSFLKRNLVVK